MLFSSFSFSCLSQWELRFKCAGLILSVQSSTILHVALCTRNWQAWLTFTAKRSPSLQSAPPLRLQPLLQVEQKILLPSCIDEIVPSPTLKPLYKTCFHFMIRETLQYLRIVECKTFLFAVFFFSMSPSQAYALTKYLRKLILQGQKQHQLFSIGNTSLNCSFSIANYISSPDCKSHVMETSNSEGLA